MSKLKFISALFISLTLYGCGGKLNGTYSFGEAPMKSSYTFKSNGTVIVDEMGMKAEYKYELDGKDIKLLTPKGTVILTMADENTIDGPMGMKWVKQK